MTSAQKPYLWSQTAMDIGDNCIVMPYFRLEAVIQPPGCSLVQGNVYPHERWDDVVGILTFPYTRDLNFGWVSGVLSFRDEEVGLGLDIVLGGNPGRVINDYTRSFPEPWYRVSRVDHSSRSLSNSGNAQPLAPPIHGDAQPRNLPTRSGVRLSYVFKEAERESSCAWYNSGLHISVCSIHSFDCGPRSKSYISENGISWSSRVCSINRNFVNRNSLAS
jgi:hypothetical protein